MPVKDRQARLEKDQRYRDKNRERIREFNKKWRDANKESIKAKELRYYAANKEKIALRHKEWREKNRERLNKRGLEYYHENKERLLEKKREYTEKNREALKQKCRERHYTLPNRYGQYRDGAKKRGFEFNLTREEFASYWMKPCSYCGSEIRTIGLDRIDSSKGYGIDNIITCCKTCNRMKGTLGFNEFIDKCKAISNKNVVVK